MRNNYDAVKRGFDILHPLMAGYIGREMNRVYHKKWWSEVLLSLSNERDLPENGDYDVLIDSLDIANCLRLIDRNWNDVFKDSLNLSYRTWAKELMGVRNSFAHIGQKDFETSYAERALDTMALLCEGFDKSGSKEIRDIYLEVRNAGSLTTIMGVEGPSPIDIPFSEEKAVNINTSKSLIDLIGTDVVQKTTLTRKVTFDGKTEAYPVYKVRLDLLYYNDQNDRIATWITRYKAENGQESLEKLSRDGYNDVIESFIYDSNPESIIRTQKNIGLVGQREPGVALSDGRIVDGNRRYTCLRRIQRDNEEPQYFETVIMDVDIQTDKKQIKLLELAIQHGEEKKVDYDLIDYTIGTYMDVERTKLLTIEEYASSTNESVADVRKRIDIALIICEFLEYIHLPEQFHVAREYQIYSLIQEMMAPLKQLYGAERKDLKRIVFNNVLMKACIDQRKFIRDIKMLIRNNTYSMYFDDQIVINENIHERFEGLDIKSKTDLDRFAYDNEDITEELQISLEKALLRSRRQIVKAKPLENIAKSASYVLDIDTKIFETLDIDEKKKLKKEIDKLIGTLEDYKLILEELL